MSFSLVYERNGIARTAGNCSVNLRPKPVVPTRRPTRWRVRALVMCTSTRTSRFRKIDNYACEVAASTAAVSAGRYFAPAKQSTAESNITTESVTNAIFMLVYRDSHARMGGEIASPRAWNTRILEAKVVARPE